MVSAERRIVITGVGAVAPLGTGKSAFWQALASGKSGIRPLQSFVPGNAASQLSAEVVDFDAKRYVKQRKSLKVMARDIQLAVGAAQLAIEDAGLEPAKLNPRRFGVNCGAGLIATELDELGPPVDRSRHSNGQFDIKLWGKHGLEHMFPLWMLKYLPNMPACHISITYDAQGPNNSITAGEASASLAIGEAFRVMARGGADNFLAGGSDSKVNPLSLVRMQLLDKVSTKWWDAPSRASRPFDADRDGMIAGEGSGMLVLEELSIAKSRKSKLYGEIVGFGSSCQPKRPHAALAAAIRLALADAKMDARKLGHVASGAAGEITADREDAMGIYEALGAAGGTVPVVAYKSYFGQMAAASGALQLIASLLASKEQKLLPTLNYERADANLPKINVSTKLIDAPYKPFVVADLSHTGHAAALIVAPVAE